MSPYCYQYSGHFTTTEEVLDDDHLRVWEVTPEQALLIAQPGTTVDVVDGALVITAADNSEASFVDTPLDVDLGG